jgi:hypothetical protein
VSTSKADDVYAALSALGFNQPTVYDRLYAYLGSLGHTGSMGDRQFAEFGRVYDLPPIDLLVAPTWTPADLTDLYAWYDASDASTLTLRTSQFAQQWRDKSGNARHLNQAADANQPVVTTQNGIGALDFQNLHFMTHDAGSDILNIWPWSFWGLASLSGVNGTNRLMTAKPALGSNDYAQGMIFSCRGPGDLPQTWYFGGTSDSPTGETLGTLAVWGSKGYVDSGNKFVAFNNNDAKPTPIAAGAAAPFRYLRVGSNQNSSGTPPTDGEYWTGKICEIILTTAGTEPAEVYPYLASKWGIT